VALHPAQPSGAGEDGRLVQIRFPCGPKVEVNFATLMTRRLTMTGSTLASANRSGKAKIRRRTARKGSGRLLDAWQDISVMDSEYASRRKAEPTPAWKRAAIIGQDRVKVDANA